MSSAFTLPETAPLDINADRLLGRIADLARIGRAADGGITRQGFSTADLRARAYLMDQAREAGLLAMVDAAGNILVRQPSSLSSDRQTVLLGSHLDTVVNAGRLDGAYGVLAALEVVEVCRTSDTHLDKDLVAVAFANEEGALFPQPFWGSMALAGRLAALPREPLDHTGRPLRQVLQAAGGNLDALGSAAWAKGSLAAYFELHIEQGPVLERTGHSIGIVDAITGRTVLTLLAHGRAGHCGTVPMDARRDAMAAAAHVVLAVQEISGERRLCRVATVGRLEPQPNTANTIAESVQLTVDLRDTDPTRLADAERALHQDLARITSDSGCRIEVIAETRSQPVATDTALREVIDESAADLGLSRMTLPSGAGHDALMVADIAPVAMIFVPSIGGASHVPHEDTAEADLVAGARVLLRSVLRTGAPTPYTRG